MPHRQMLSQLVDRYQMRYPEEAQMIERLQALSGIIPIASSVSWPWGMSLVPPGCWMRRARRC